ncbi:MAG: DUF4381 domain-containing protein [Porticoccaceae bacterium]|nr:DUF4381 domain-containing protein [Porticoccaceae bacterium]
MGTLLTEATANPLTEATANPLTKAAPNPLDQLRDIHLPEPISWWPLAPGWWILILTGCALLAWLVRFLYRRHNARLYRRQAQKQLQALQQGGNSQQQLRGLFELLKQTAHSAYPNLQPGSQSIMAFIGFMQCSCDKPVFDNLNLDLDLALYSSGSQLSDQTDQLFADASRWIKLHLPQHKLELDKPC